MIRKLYLSGVVCRRTPEDRCHSYYSWPLGKPQREVDEIIERYKKSFCKVSVEIEHVLED